MTHDLGRDLLLLGIGAVILAAVLLIVLDALTRWAKSAVDRMVDDGLAAIRLEDADWAGHVDQAVALAVPLYGSETASRIAAIIASNEAERADWDEPSRWTR